MIATPHRKHPDGSLVQRKYFDQMKDTLVDRMIVEAHSDHARAELVRATGICDDELLQELADLGFVKHTLVTLRLMPLVMVAWSDHSVDDKQRQVIYEAARKLGIRKDTDPYVMLEHWLENKPPRIMLDAWKRYICGLMSGLGLAPRRRLIENLKKQMLTVAAASGGFLGFGRVSSKEKETIEAMVKTLKICASTA